MATSKLSIILTPKQLNAIKLALRLSAGIKSTEKDRLYLKSLLEKIQQQEGAR